MEELKKSNKIPGSCDVFTRPEEIKELSKYLGDLKRSYDESLTLDKTKEKVSEVKDIRNLPNTLDILNGGKASAEPLLRVGRDSLDIEKGKVTIRPDRINQVTGKLSKLGITSLSEIDTRIKKLGGEGLKEVSIRGDKELLNGLGELRDLKVDIERLNPLELSKVSEHLEKIRANLPVDSLSSRVEKLGGVWTSQVGPDTELDKLMVSRKDTQLEDDIESLRADQIRSLIARKENLAGTEEIDNLLGRIEKLTSDGVISLSESLEKIKTLEEIRELSLGREDLRGMEGIEDLSKHLERLSSSGEISLSEGLEKIKAFNEIRDLVTLKENLSGISKIDNLSDRLEKLVSTGNITLSEVLEMIRAAQGNPELEASLERIYRGDDPNLEDYKDLISFPREYRLDLPTGSEEIIDDRKEDLSDLLDYLDDNRPDPSLSNSKESLTDPRNFTQKDIADDSKQIYTMAKEVTETLRPVQDIELEKRQEKVQGSEVRGLSDEIETIKFDPEARLELEGEKEELVALGKEPTLSNRKEEIRNVESISKLPKRSETIVAPEPIKKLDETPERLTVETENLELEKDKEIISGKSNWNGELEDAESKKPIENLGRLYEDLKKEAEGKGGKAFESLAKKEDLEATKKVHNLPEESENLIDERVTKLSTEREDIREAESPIDLPEKSDKLRDSREVTLESPELKEVIRDKRTSELEVGKERLHVENFKKTPEIEKELPESSQLEGIKVTEIKLPETTDEVLVGPKDTPVHLSDEKEEITDTRDLISLPGKGTIRKPAVVPNNDIVLEDQKEINPDQTEWDGKLEEGNEDLPGFQKTIKLEDQKELNPDQTEWNGQLEEGNEDLPGGPKSVHLSEYQEKNPDTTRWDGNLEDYQEANPDVTKWNGTLEDYQEKNPDTTGWKGDLEDYQEKNPDETGWKGELEDYQEKNPDKTGWKGGLEDYQEKNPDVTGWKGSLEDYQEKNPDTTGWSGNLEDYQEKNPDETGWNSALEDYLDERPEGDNWTEGDGLYTEDFYKGTDVYSHTDENISGISNDEDWTSSDEFPTDKLLRPNHSSKINPGKNFIIDTQTEDEEIQGDDYVNTPYTKSQYEETVAWKITDESPTGQTDHAQWTEGDGLYTEESFKGTDVYSHADENTSGISNDEDWTSSDEFPTDKLLRPTHGSKVNPGKNYIIDTQTDDEEIQGDDYVNTPYTKAQYEQTVAWKLEDESPSGQTDHSQWTEKDGLEDTIIKRANHSSKINPGKNYKVDTQTTDEEVQKDDYVNTPYTKAQYEEATVWKITDENTSGISNDEEWTSSDEFPTDKLLRPTHESKINPGKNYKVDTQTTDEEIKGDDYKNIPYTKSQYENATVWKITDESPSGQSDHSQWTEGNGLEDTKIIRADHSSKINPGKNFIVDTQTDDEEIQGDDYKNVPYTKAQYEETVAWKLEDESPTGQTDHAQWTEGDGLYTEESFKGTDAFTHEGEKPKNQTDHSQWTEEDGLEDTKIIRAKHSSKVNPGKNHIIDTQTTDEEIQGDDYKNVPYEKSQYEQTVAWKLEDESPANQTGHAQWSESTGLYDKISEDENGNPVSPGLKKSIYDEVADENLNIYYNNLIAFARNRSREAKQSGTVEPGWYEKVGGLISTHLSKSKVTEKDCKEFEEELFKTIIPSIVNDPGPWEKLIIDSSNAEGPINQTDWTGIANRDDNEDKFENMPHYHLPDNWLSLLDPSAFIRFLAEISIGWIPSKKKGLGVLRKVLMDEALGAMVASRDLLERNVLKSNRDRLPGGDLKWWQGMNDVQDAVDKGVSTLANLISGQGGIDMSTPKNRPDDTEGGTYDALNLIGATQGTGATHFEEGKKKISFSKRYYTPALKRTLTELTNIKENPKDISNFKTLKELIANPNTSNLTCANRYLMNPQTLDNNSHWEIFLCPYLGKENGSCSYLPNIEWYNKINREQYAMDTFYTWNMPITSFEYSRTKQEQKSLPLFAGELSYPVGLEFINELRLTIVDDQFKTFRKYFEQVAEVSTYYSVVHDKEYYENEPNEKTEFVSHDIHLVAPYKNITFECKIYCLTPQLNMIDCYDLLVVMKDFTIERSGDIQGEAGDLVVNFSVVGEDPEPNELLTNSKLEKYTVKIQPSARVNNGDPKNKLGGLISSIATGGLKLL